MPGPGKGRVECTMAGLWVCTSVWDLQLNVMTDRSMWVEAGMVMSQSRGGLRGSHV